MTPELLRARAVDEVYDLGLAPRDPRDRERWNDQRRGAVAFLTRLADGNRTLLITASLMAAAEWNDRSVRDLLSDAAQQCRHS
jgi:hypothetical protein